MPALVNYGGDGDFSPAAGALYSNPIDSSLFLSLSPHVDVYCPPRKRSRISAPFVFRGDWIKQEKRCSIDVLPDECLFEIFRRLPGAQERSTCACVSKRWLMLQSSIRRAEIFSSKPGILKEEPVSDKVEESSKINGPSPISKDEEIVSVTFNGEEESEGDGYLSRCLEGKKATDIRLAAMSVGTCSRGGLGKLQIRGNNSTRGVTNLGLTAIARGCPSLRVLSLWNVSSVSDEGLLEIANGCHMLEKLDLCRCPLISDKGMLAIAKNCPNLTSLTIESCSKIGNEGLQAIGSCCPNLKSISIKDCPMVGDQGVAGLVSSASSVLTKIKLQALNITDLSLAVIGHYGKAVIDITLTGLQSVGERGFWVLGHAFGLQKLKSFTITSCAGVTDVGLEAVGKGCPNLRQLCLRRCSFVSDEGLKAFTQAAAALESLQLEECNRITRLGGGEYTPSCWKLLSAITPPLRTQWFDQMDGPDWFATSNTAYFGKLSMVHCLLQTDTSIAYLLDNDGYSPIHMAAINNHTNVIQDLIQWCPDSGELLDRRGLNVLRIAIERDKPKVVEYVLKTAELEELINEPDNDGNTPLHVAIVNRHLSIVYLLAAHDSVDMRAVNREGLTALDIALADNEPSLKLRKFQILRTLISAGAQWGKWQQHIRENRQPLRGEAPTIESYKAMANTILVVAALIATVTFVAAFALPGGYSKQQKGRANLTTKLIFKLFIIFDTMGLFSSIIVSFLLIRIGIGDQDLLLRTLCFAVEMMLVAVGSMAGIRVRCLLGYPRMARFHSGPHLLHLSLVTYDVPFISILDHTSIPR